MTWCICRWSWWRWVRVLADRQGWLSLRVWLNLWPLLYPLPPPGHQISTAERWQDKPENRVRRWRRGGKKNHQVIPCLIKIIAQTTTTVLSTKLWCVTIMSIAYPWLAIMRSQRWIQNLLTVKLKFKWENNNNNNLLSSCPSVAAWLVYCLCKSLQAMSRSMQ